VAAPETPAVNRGDVYRATLVPRSGSEPRVRRPVIVVSHDGFNETPGWRSIIVVPVSTSGSQARRGPTAVALPAGSGGLERAGVALCHQVTTLDLGKLTARVGALPRHLVVAVDAGLRAALDLE
jgi:mRNA-degrading endonuclease toxin of MazEF toxin-antitoxin module